MATQKTESIWKRTGALPSWTMTGYGNISTALTIFTPSVGVWRREQGADYDQSEFILNGTSSSLTFSGDGDASNLIINPSNSYLTLGHNSIGVGGEVYEVLLFADVVTDERIRLIEGYLAHKWNTASSLPNDHPFKSQPSNQLPLLKTATTFNYESNASSYSIRVQAKDEYNATVENVFEVSLLNVSEPPSAITLTSNTIRENLPPGTVVGQLSATDPDGAGLVFTHQYVQFPPTEDGSNPDPTGPQNFFEVESSGTIRTIRTLDYESDPIAHNMTIWAEDPSGLISESTFSISVLDEDPELSFESKDFEVLENQARGTLVARFSELLPDEFFDYGFDFEG